MASLSVSVTSAPLALTAPPNALFVFASVMSPVAVRAVAPVAATVPLCVIAPPFASTASPAASIVPSSMPSASANDTSAPVALTAPPNAFAAFVSTMFPVAASVVSPVAATTPLCVIAPPFASTVRPAASIVPSSMPSASVSDTSAPVALTAPPNALFVFASVMSPVAVSAVAPVAVTTPLCVMGPFFASTVRPSAFTAPSSMASLSVSDTSAPVALTAPPNAFAAFVSTMLFPSAVSAVAPVAVTTPLCVIAPPFAVTARSRPAVTSGNKMSLLPAPIVMSIPADRASADVNFPPVDTAVRLPLSTDTTPFKARSVAAVRVTSPPVAVMFVAVRCPPAVAVMPFPAVTSPRFRSLASFSVTLPLVAVAVTAPVKSFSSFCSVMLPCPAVSVVAPATWTGPAAVIEPTLDVIDNPLPAMTLFTVKSPPLATSFTFLEAKISLPSKDEKAPPAANSTPSAIDITNPAVRFVAAMAITFPSASTSASVRESFPYNVIDLPSVAADAVTAPPKSLPVLASTMSPFPAVSVLAPVISTNPPSC